MLQARPTIYWDWNATTPPHPAVIRAVRDAESQLWANPASPHSAGRAARSRIEGVREQLAELLAVHPRDVVFASSGTEANNLALRGARALVVSRLEHASVVRVAEWLEAQNVPVRWLRVPQSGRIEADDVRAAMETVPVELRAHTWVVLAGANHETGVLQDVEAVLEVARAFGARVHVDAAQMVGKLDPQLYRGADSLTVVAHKIRGPKGIAALAWRGGAPPPPVLLGGSQERGLRPGTLSAPLIVGFGIALERLDPGRYEPLAALRDEVESQLAQYAQVNGAGTKRLPHVSNLSFRDWTGERLVAALDLGGLCVSTGSACSVGTAQPSEAVLAMMGAERARQAVRISLGEDTDADEVTRALRVFQRVLKRPS